MKTHSHPLTPALRTLALTGACLAFISAASLSAQTPKVDPATHAAHVAAGTHPATQDAAKSDPAFNQKLSELQAKIAQLESSLGKNAPAPTTASAMPGMSGAGAPMAGMSSPASGTGSAMASMGSSTAPAPAAAMASGGMAMGMDMMKMGGMMGMMDKMMGMMDKMMPMGGGAMPAAAPMPAGGGMGMMDMDMMKMGGGGAMPAAAPAAPMSGGGMGMMAMDKMEMAGMMGMGGMGGAAAMPQSALPGFPGASHLYHLGATGFFLDHPQHIALTTEQTAGLNKAKEQALLAKSTADRAKEQAEQELWMLTAADQPDAAKIEAKLAEIGKLTADERLAFIRAVGDASKLLTDAQRQSLTGFAPPAPAMPAAGMAAPAPAMAPMKDM